MVYRISLLVLRSSSAYFDEFELVITFFISYFWILSARKSALVFLSCTTSAIFLLHVLLRVSILDCTVSVTIVSYDVNGFSLTVFFFFIIVGLVGTSNMLCAIL